MTLLYWKQNTKNSSTPMKCFCNKHSSKIQYKRHGDLVQGYGCNFCGCEITAKKNSLDFAFIKKSFEERGYILLSAEYINSSTYLEYICPEHPNEIQQIIWDSFKQGHGCRFCGVEKNSGENHYCYNPNLSEEDRLKERNIEGYDEWRKDVYKNDNYKCNCCGITRNGLNAHHLYNYADYPLLRTDVTNGVALCNDCHIEFHIVYGKNINTPEQYKEFKLSK